jgi:hypothetical protein
LPDAENAARRGAAENEGVQVVEVAEGGDVDGAAFGGGWVYIGQIGIARRRLGDGGEGDDVVAGGSFLKKRTKKLLLN